MTLVWLDMTQEELDRAYTQDAYAPNRLQVLERFHVTSNWMRRRIGEPERLRYGPGKMEGIDLFRAKATAPCPAVIVVHGGAWRSGSAAQYAFTSEVFTNTGAHCLLPDFDFVQDHDGNLMPLADQVGRAIEYICLNADEIGIDPANIFICAHSSGSHLAAAVLSGMKERFPGIKDDSIKGALLCSGMYELKPVSLSARSDYVDFTDEVLDALSPMRHMEKMTTPVIVAHGTLETPEFKRQTIEFAAALKERGLLIESIVADQSNHLEIFETLANPYGLLGDAALRMIRDA